MPPAKSALNKLLDLAAAFVTQQKGTWNLTWRTAADGTCQRVCAPINWNTAYACTP